MKCKFLVFNKMGEISEKSTQSDIFEADLFPEYEHYKRYDNYIILYNVEKDSENLTVFYFTDDKYTTDVALLRVENNNVINLTYKMYAKQLSKIKTEPNDYYSDSDTEIIDTEPFTYTKLFGS